MNYQTEYYNGLPIPPEYAYHYPSVYDPFPPYWRYPVNPYYEPRAPYMPFGANYSELIKQKKIEEAKKGQSVKRQLLVRSESNLEPRQSLDQSPCVKIQTQLSDIYRLQQADLKYQTKVKQEEKYVIEDVESYEKLLQIFKAYHGDLYEYNTLLKRISSEDEFTSAFFTLIDKKIKSFKKSKEQMIKIIIRKTQRHYKNTNKCKKDQRFVKYGGFKSMNTVYLETMFSDPLFLESFEAVALRFKSEFDNENKKKIQLISCLLGKMKTNEQIETLEKMISEKNKMAWPEAWLHRMNKTIYELYESYGNKKIQVISTLYKAMQK